jgi:hypothetical protein
MAYLLKFLGILFEMSIRFKTHCIIIKHPRLMRSFVAIRKRTFLSTMLTTLILVVSTTIFAQNRALSPPLSNSTVESIRAQVVQSRISSSPFSEAQPNAHLTNRSNLAMPTFQDSTCVDLVFDSVKVLKITEKYIELEFSILNKGNTPAPLFGTKRGQEDNVAVHFYYSGTQRLTRGSIMADGIYLTEGLRESKGYLQPNAVYKQRFKLSLEKKNRFYGVIVLQLDAFDTLRHECDETNNVKAIVPKWY